MTKHKQKSLNKIQWLKDIRIVGAELRNNVWKERYLSIVTNQERLHYWQQREKDLLNRLVVTNSEQLAKNDNPSVKEAQSWLKEIWPFGEHCERIYKLPADLDAIYLAVGLRLDMLYRVRVFVTEEMVKVIVGEWQFAVKPQIAINELNVFLSFGPCFEGDYMGYGDPMETFWGYIEADLKSKGLFDERNQIPTKRKLKKKKIKPKHIEGEWSNPMSMSTMMSKVSVDGYKKFKTWAKQYDLQNAGNRQLWKIRLDQMDLNTRNKFEAVK